MRRLLKILGFALVTLVLLVVAVPFLVPADMLKSKALELLESQTGRKVALGKVSFSLFPNIAIKAEDVSISNPAWVKDGAVMASVKSMRLGVELLPLLHKEVHVTDVSLGTPIIHLVKNGDKANWVMTPANAGEATSGKKAAVPADEAPAKKSSGLPLQLDSFSIDNG